MVLVPLMLRVEKKMIEEIGICMDMVIKDENDIIRFRMYEGTSKQEWYRTLLRAGLDAKLKELNEKKKVLDGQI